MKVKKKYKILAVVAAVLIASIVWIAWGNSALMVNEITITSNKLPNNFSGLRIAQVSDLHNAEFGDNNEKLLDMIKETESDIIVLTGDLVDSDHTDIEIAIAFAEQAVQLAPTYYVTGNHEARIFKYDELKDGLINVGVTVLENESVTLEKDGESISLIGIDDPSFLTNYLFGDSVAVTESALTELISADDAYTILLAHRPELFETYMESGVDLVFSGHAHGGQFRLPFIGGIVAPGQGLFPEYDAGLYTEGNTNMVVSRGIGNSIIPFRVNNRPEIVVVELERE